MRDQAAATISFFGTSIMEHLEAHATVLDGPHDLPPVGTPVIIESHRKRGWVHTCGLGLQVRRPTTRIVVDNQGVGGATTRDVLATVRAAANGMPGPDIAVLGAGINDLWLCLYGEPSAGVALPEYRANYTSLLDTLTGWARRTVCVSETPFGPDENLDIAAINTSLAAYNAVAAEIAAGYGVAFVDLWNPMLTAGEALGADRSLWSDCVHLTELGDTLVARIVEPIVHELI